VLATPVLVSPILYLYLFVILILSLLDINIKMLCVHKTMCTYCTAETKGGRHNTVSTGIQIKISTGIRGLSKDPDPELDSGSFGKTP
jgi:hypothetical protein